MIEDGTIAVLFWVFALGSAALDHADGLFEREAAQRFGTVSVAAAQIDGRDAGTEGRVSWYPGVSYGPLRPVMEIGAGTDGGGYAGIGFAVQKELDLGPVPLFLGMEFVPGLWLGDAADRLGGAFTIRSGVEVGVRLGAMDGARLSVVMDHRSNGELYSDNAGLETVGLRLHMPF
ncbi:acyloxyacyl hydrolase [Halovulum marinum]|nr:acyloxyacyl hydrolase [Halovulum marinum]